MKLVSAHTFLLVTITTSASAIVGMTTFSCGSSAPSGIYGDNDSSLGGGGGSSGSNSGSGSGSVSGSGSGGGASSGAGASSGGPGGGMEASLVTYDGPPPSFTDAGVLCATPDGLPIKFNPMYSGYDGVHTYQVPAFVVGADPASITWGSSDPTVVDMQSYVSGVMITTKGVPDGGQVTIVARSDAGCGSAPLTITAFTPEQWEAGAARYNNGNQLTTTSLLDQLDAGQYVDAGFDGNFDGSGYDAGDSSCFSLPGTFTNPFESPPAACTDCHGPVGNSQLFGRTLFSDVSHTPEQTGGYSEAELMAVWYTGTVPAGGYFDPNLICYTDWHLAHQWKDINTTEGQIGMNAYLRSLTPKEQEGCFDLFSSCDSGM